MEQSLLCLSIVIVQLFNIFIHITRVMYIFVKTGKTLNKYNIKYIK